VINPAIGKVNELVKIVSKSIDYFDVITRYKESHIVRHIHHYIALPSFHSPVDSMHLTIAFAVSEVDIRIPLQFEVMGRIQRYIIIIINRYTYGVVCFMRICLYGGNGSSHFCRPAASSEVVVYFHAFGSVYTKITKFFAEIHLKSAFMFSTPGTKFLNRQLVRYLGRG
jgi:hypothetical protein